MNRWRYALTSGCEKSFTCHRSLRPTGLSYIPRRVQERRYWSGNQKYACAKGLDFQYYVRSNFQAFLQTADYDLAISDFFRKKYATGTKQLTLRYGVNPHQIPAQAYVREGDLPIKGDGPDTFYLTASAERSAWLYQFT